MAPLTSPQHQVITLLAAGAPVTDAAAHAGLHRTTVHHWMRTHSTFRLALDQARRLHADLLRTGLASLADHAVAALRVALTSADASPSLRLRAATVVLRALGADRLPTAPSDFAALDALFAPPATEPDPALREALDAAEPAPADLSRVSHPTPVHHPSSAFITAPSSAPAPLRAAPTPPRNAPCPCGSGAKYKRCCHITPKLAAAAA